MREDDKIMEFSSEEIVEWINNTREGSVVDRPPDNDNPLIKNMPSFG